MIRSNEVLKLHEFAIERYGGTPGIRDESVLRSALSRPYTSFLNQPLYQTAEEKACAVLESIVKDKPFLDGNKRTGYLVYRMLLKCQGMDISASQEEKLRLLMSIEEARLKFGEITAWTRERLKHL